MNDRRLMITAAVSLALHAGAVTAVLLFLHTGAKPPDEPEKPAEVELVMVEHRGDARPVTAPSPQSQAAPGTTEQSPPQPARKPTEAQAAPPPVPAAPDVKKDAPPPPSSEPAKQGQAAKPEQEVPTEPRPVSDPVAPTALPSAVQSAVAPPESRPVPSPPETPPAPSPAVTQSVPPPSTTQPAPPQAAAQAVAPTQESTSPATQAPTPPATQAPTPPAAQAPTPAAAQAPTPPAAQAPSPPEPTITLQGTDSPSEARAFGDHILPARPDAVFHNRPPEYPAEAARNGEEGAVVVMVHISTAGRAAGVDVVSSSGSVLLDRAASEAVMQWRFLPAVKDGEPVASQMAMQFVFENK